MKKLFYLFLSALSGILFFIFGGSLVFGQEMVCYYMARQSYIKISGRVMDSETSNSVKGIRLMLLSGNVTNDISLSNGNFKYEKVLYDNNKRTVEVTDIDGITNGEYKPVKIKLKKDAYGEINTNIDIYLDKK